ncbi:unnamed protein product [Rotaria magnacalcarata]
MAVNMQNIRRAYLLSTVIIILLIFFVLLPNYKYIHTINPAISNKRTSSLTFWVINLHDGCRIDTTTLLQGLDQTVIIADHVQRKNPYLTEFTRPRILFARDKGPLAPFMYSHTSYTVPLSENDIRNFFNYYKKDSVMMNVNAFYCSFPSSLCEVYMPLNRTIIWLPAHRFTLARCSRPEIDQLILHMQQSVRSEQQPKHFVAAGGRYDQEYIKYYTGLDAILLPTNSLWYAFNVTRFTQARTEILVGPLQTHNHPLMIDMKNAATALNSSFQFASAKILYGHYHLQQIADHRAVVLLPYAVLSYGITELYALGIPMFVPTIDFIVELNLVIDRTLIDKFYCGRSLKFDDMPKQHTNSHHPFSPEDIISPEAIHYWLQFADYYQLPYIQTFSSWTNLIEKLSTTNFKTVHDNMHDENVRRKVELTKKWKSVFAKIDRMQRVIPQDYDTAIKQLWNTTRLQAI